MRGGCSSRLARAQKVAFLIDNAADVDDPGLDDTDHLPVLTPDDERSEPATGPIFGPMDEKKRPFPNGSPVALASSRRSH
jgi:hypothetical protein